MRFDNKEKDPIKKLQFWTRESIYNQMVEVCPNIGDLSDLMREGLEIGIASRKKRLLANQLTEQNQEEQEAS